MIVAFFILALDLVTVVTVTLLTLSHFKIVFVALL